MLLKVRVFSPQIASLLSYSSPSPTARCFRNPFFSTIRRSPISYLSLRNSYSYPTRINPNPSPNPPLSRSFSATSETAEPPTSDSAEPPVTGEAKSRLSQAATLVNRFYFVPPGVKPEEVTEKMVLLGSNIVWGPHVGQHTVGQVEFINTFQAIKGA